MGGRPRDESVHSSVLRGELFMWSFSNNESVHGILYSDAYPIQVTGSATKAIKWPATGVKTLKKTPMSWIGNFLFALYGQYGLTKEVIAAMMSRNEGGM